MEIMCSLGYVKQDVCNDKQLHTAGEYLSYDD